MIFQFYWIKILRVDFLIKSLIHNYDYYRARLKTILFYKGQL